MKLSNSSSPCLLQHPRLTFISHFIRLEPLHCNLIAFLFSFLTLTVLALGRTLYTYFF
ncbi:hypothetical protein BDW68DRAFT_151542, partial [Aspergillus falconensis]